MIELIRPRPKVHVVQEPLVGLVPDEIEDGAVVDRARRARRLAMRRGPRSVEQMNERTAPVVNADERAIPVNRPGHRVARDAEVGFHVAHQLQRILARAVALVDEGE